MGLDPSLKTRSSNLASPSGVLSKLNPSHNCPCSSRQRTLCSPAPARSIPNAFDVLGKDYDTKLTNLRKENELLKEKVDDFERKLSQAEIEITKEQAEKLEETARVIKLNNEIQKMAVAIAVRGIIIKERLGIVMPNPFESRD
jgi:peptidoglycan hydrolase CwlO-like protein